MSTIIYLFNQKVQILSGSEGKNSISVKKAFTEFAPEGSIINGIVMDVDSFVGFLKELIASKKIDTKEASLVVSSSKFVGKTIEMPALNDRKASEYITREFADMGKSSDSVYSYISLPGGNKNIKKVYAENIDPDFIKDYIDIFNQAGIKLKAIYSGESCLIDFTAMTAAKESKTFDLIVADDNSLTTVLWVDGNFYYYNNTRCFNDPGTEGYANDIARSVSQLNQFMQARRIESPLEKVLLAGIMPEDLSMYSMAIRETGVNAKVEQFTYKTGASYAPEYQQYIHAASGLYAHDKTSNFLTRISLSGKKKEQSEEGRHTKILLGICFAIMLLITLITYAFSLSKANELKVLTDYIENPSVQMQSLTFDEISSRNNFLYKQKNSIDNLQQNIYTYPLGSEKITNVIDECANGYAQIEYQAFDADEGFVSFKADASDVETINVFIKNLSKEDMFKDVDYTGYRFEEDTKQWNINVTCVLAESAGKEVK